MSNDDIRQSDPISLTHMMDLDAAGQHLWEPDELESILAHQLATPLECDLLSLNAGLTARLDELNAACRPPIATFADLLYHAEPPTDLLELTKTFAKSCRTNRNAPLPDEISTVLYFLSIIVALVKCDHRITRMDDAALRYSLDWALRQPWLDGASRALFQQGQERLGSS
ncbi:MAG: hypothetical protein HQ567_11845 [Candidatus Nealsonbacteria bacterium]|nr:hypothetical protein [Candidatus Nealsonbacteria bacterium]